MIWIGGSEPLVHPGIGHFVRALAGSGHYVFLETNGALLRGRIHELQPSPQVFLVVRLVASRKPKLDLAVEGLRAARLSGFFTAVHSLVGINTNLDELKGLRAFLEKLGVDGWLITAECADAQGLNRVLAVRALLSNAMWRWLSEQVERELLWQGSSGEARSNSKTRESQEPHEEACGESVKAI